MTRKNEFNPDWKIRRRNRCKHERAKTIVDHHPNKIEWCPNCGSWRQWCGYDGPEEPDPWRSPKVALDVCDAQDELQDIKDAHAATINEVCDDLAGDDRKHCACVPFLRAEIDKLNAEREVAGVCRLCEQCHVYVCEEEPCELMPTLGDDGLLKCPNFKVVY